MQSKNAIKLTQHYRELFLSHGDSPKSVQFDELKSQRFRYKQLIHLANIEGKSVLDVGCGIGHFYEYLTELKLKVAYTGIDVVAEMIEFAAQKFPKATFINHNILNQPLSLNYDYVFLNAIFNNAEATTDQYMQSLLTAAYKHAIKGMAFNFISNRISFFDAEMAYHDPVKVLKFCIDSLSIHTHLFHGYERRDVAVFVYR